MRPGPLLAAAVASVATIGLVPPPAAAAGATASLTSAVGRLLTLVEQAVADESVPAFARTRIAWLAREHHGGTLSIVLLKNAASAGLDGSALMASGIADGRQTIVISQPRFEAFLQEEAASGDTTFSRRQRNDFLLGLVHETVHLESPLRDPNPTLEGRLQEEERAWRIVDLQVVRPLRAHHEPMHPRFIDADEAIRSCGDKSPCPALRRLLLSSEINRS